ncbi:DUF6522 family protein [Tropicimonas isoalkanivorans]|uniref:Uncharacterized protein n=1 Tax=Tropicimonas isoalkanivorans TaxID=441112 RepID=A0A1I1RCI9_9RHOB|nr:DUF6522 family protein [Tropicimonas isoalkanivorans]SFD31962.1 hypothetical protein SAMN04488094_1321 [Tropicimonas isoalkanivorans]
MTDVVRHRDQFIVDAQMLARAFDLSVEETRNRMQGGQIASLCETGEGEDAGRWRLTFRHQGRALRLIVDTRGAILSKSTFPVGHPNIATRTR